MESLPSMWRTELMHPLFVHFPIALLIFATLALLVVRLNLWPRHQASIRGGGLLMLFSGVVLAWVSVYSGVQADGVVGREVCDPTVLEDHERLAFGASYLFSAAAIIEIAGSLLQKQKWYPAIRRFLVAGVLILHLLGAATIGYVGHLGAKLVYQQAAAVHQPSEDCSEFE
ncbi:MAG TPA: DUF2231 domain-containing protein [Bacteroidales bacterium]|nr:DUF2231 domain-containing protein [Bacteroidales bacterium]